MPLVLIYKKSHRTRAVETFKIWPNFESFHSSYPMKFFIENWHTKSQGHKKIVLILYEGAFTPFPPTQLEIRIVLLLKEGIGKDTCPVSVHL